MKALRVVPDSSFYLFFLDDIARPIELCGILAHEGFSFWTGIIIKAEIAMSEHFEAISGEFANTVGLIDYYRYGELVRPFFSLEEIRKGEHEVVVIAFIWDATSEEFHAIIDDGPVRRFVERRFPSVSARTTGTLGFIERCAMGYEVLTRVEAIDLLKAMKTSDFRIKPEIVDEAIHRLEA